MVFLDILYGPIASGKSTYAATRAAGGALIYNDDSVHCTVHGGNYSLYDTDLKPLYKMIGMQIIRHAAAIGRDVVVDSTGLRKSTRSRFREIAMALGFRTRLVVFRGGKFEGQEDGVRRFNSDPRGKTLEAWKLVGMTHKSFATSINYETEKYSEILYIPWK